MWCNSLLCLQTLIVNFLTKCALLSFTKVYLRFLSFGLHARCNIFLFSSSRSKWKDFKVNVLLILWTLKKEIYEYMNCLGKLCPIWLRDDSYCCCAARTQMDYAKYHILEIRKLVFILHHITFSITQ